MRKKLIEGIAKYLKGTLTSSEIITDGKLHRMPGMLQGSNPHIEGAAADIADQYLLAIDHEKKERMERNATAALAGLTAANRYNKADPYTIARKAHIIAQSMEEARAKFIGE